MIIGCYIMDLYCDLMEDRNHPYKYLPQNFTGETASECRKQARKRGWIFRRNGTMICPLCVAEGEENVP